MQHRETAQATGESYHSGTNSRRLARELSPHAAAALLAPRAPLATKHFIQQANRTNSLFGFCAASGSGDPGSGPSAALATNAAPVAVATLLLLLPQVAVRMRRGSTTQEKKPQEQEQELAGAL